MAVDGCESVCDSDYSSTLNKKVIHDTNGTTELTEQEKQFERHLLTNSDQLNLYEFRYILQQYGFQYPNVVQSVYEKLLTTPQKNLYVRACIQNGARPDQKTAQGPYPIHLATDSCDVEILKELLQYNEVNVDEMWNGKSALDCYLERTSNNNFEEIDKCVQELLKHHAYMNIDNLTTFLKNLSNNYEPNFVIIFISLYDRNFIDAYKASKHKIELCLEALHEKVLNNDLWKLQNTLHESEDLFSQEYQAIINSDNETISYLLEVCIARRYIKAAKTIISAKLTAANEMQNRADLYDWLPKRVLTRCCQVGNFQMLKYLFHNFDGNVYNQYLISDSIELLQLLVRKIDPTRENCPYLRCLELCLNNPAIDIDEVDGKNCSALHYAGMFKLTKVQKLLLQKGAYLGGMDDNGASTMAAIDPTVLADFFDTCMFNNGETFKSLDYHIVIKLNNFVPPKYKIKQLASENETQVLVQDERRVANSSGTNEQADELQNGSSPIQPLAQDNVEQPELVNIQEPNSNTSTQVPVEDDNSAANTSGTDEQADELQNGSSPIQPLAQHNIQQPELGNIQEPNSSTSTQVPVQDERIGVNSLGTDEQAVELLNGSSSMQPSVNGNIEQYELKMFPKSNTFSQGQTKQTAKRNETSKTNHVSYKSIIPALAEFTDASKISKLCSADQNARHMLIDHPIILILTLLREPISTNYATWLMIALKLLPLSIFFIVVPFDHNKNNFWFMLGIGITFCCRLSYTLLESRYIIWIPFTKILIRKEEKKKILSLLLQRHVWTRLVEIFVLIYSLGLIFIDSDYTNVYTIVTLFAGYEVTQCLAGFDRFSEPIYMLVVVVKVVLKNLLLFAYIFVTFAFSFFVVFRLAHPTTSSVALGEIENFNNSDYKTNDSLGNSTISLNISQKQEASHVTLPLAHDNSYDSPESNLKQWLLKVIVMYIGEINADRFGFEKNFNYMVVGVFVLYLAVVCISLANMITGLAVNNISEIRAQSRRLKICRKINHIRLIENFPAWLKKHFFLHQYHQITYITICPKRCNEINIFRLEGVESKDDYMLNSTSETIARLVLNYKPGLINATGENVV